MRAAGELRVAPENPSGGSPENDRLVYRGPAPPVASPELPGASGFP